MMNNSTPQFPLPGWWAEDNKQVVHEFDGKRYYLRHLLTWQQYVLYRIGDPCVEDPTLFVPCGVRHATPQRPLLPDDNFQPGMAYPKALFAAQVRSGQSGRLLLYNHLTARNSMAALFFAQDGTGRFHDWHPFLGDEGWRTREPLDFVWDGRGYDVAFGGDILTCPEETLLPLCEDVFVQQVWPRMKNPYPVADNADKRFRFVYGSRAELERLTRCICQADPTLFADPADTRRVRVAYQACTSRQPGGLCMPYGPEFRTIQSEVTRKLCTLAFAHNTFEGETWTYFDGQKAAVSVTPAEVRVVVDAPSMHERTEAVLTLSEWLEGKISDRERRRLLGLENIEAV